MTYPEVFDCPFCGNKLVWSDAVIFGCADCGAEFEETEVRGPTFTPFDPEPPEED